MKKIISIILCAILVAGAFAGCAAKDNTGDSNKKLSVVTTIFPVYDWINNVLGDRAQDVDVTMLLDSGADLHSYQPTADDIIKISSCDVFVYVGGESDAWVDDALKNATNSDMKTLDLMEALGDRAKEEELVEGMQGEEEEEEGEEAPEYDEHIWLSVKNASFLSGKIAEALGEADAANKDAYSANAAAYQAKLDELDAQYQQLADGAKTKTLLFGDRFPFRYLTDDYGIKYYAAFIGCSAETEASFETVTFLSGKVDELGLKNIMTIETGDKKIAETIIANTENKDQSILTLNSMQSVQSDGETYLGVMQSNLEVLKTALN